MAQVLVVTNVTPGLQAHKVGMVCGDIIVSYNKAPISKNQDLVDAVLKAKKENKKGMMIIRRRQENIAYEFIDGPLGIMAESNWVGSEEIKAKFLRSTDYSNQIAIRWGEAKKYPAPDNAVSDRPSSQLGISMSAPKDFLSVIDECFNNVELDNNVKLAIKKTLALNYEQRVTTEHLKQRLEILYQHERNYLDLIKEFKEEIKFIGSVQEDLRKERARFFSGTLREVTEALKDAQVSNDVASQWLQELVNTYTKSLNLSAGLIQEHTTDIISQIRKQSEQTVNSAMESVPDSESN